MQQVCKYPVTSTLIFTHFMKPTGLMQLDDNLQASPPRGSKLIQHSVMRKTIHHYEIVHYMCSTHLKSTILNKIPSDIRLCIPQPQTLEKERDAERKPEFFDRSDETWLLKVLRIE